MAEAFDLVVVGGGPGGYVSAIRASQLKMKVALVERENLGGICLNWGCIPTKALLRASEINHLLHSLDAYGFAADNIRFDFAKVVKRSRSVAGQLSGGVKHLLRKNKVTVFDGHAKLAGAGKLAVSKDGKPVAELVAKHIILATGARARVLPGIEPDGKLIWSYREAMTAPALPKRLIVIGSGAIGSEFASFYRNMGSEVTLIEAMDRMLPVEDAEVSAFVHKAFEKQGMKVMVGAKLQGVRKEGDAIAAIVEAGGKVTEIKADRLISAVGIVGNVEDLGLEGTKIQVDRTHILTDAFGRTGEPGIYAIGDIIAGPMLAHKAEDEGVALAELLAGQAGHVNYDTIPGVVYTFPEVAAVGRTEEELKSAGVNYKAGKFPFMANGRAKANQQTEGFVKVLADAVTDRVLGVHIIGPAAGELIHECAVLMEFGGSSEDLARTCHAHPTLSEAVKEAAMAVEGRAIHA